MNYDPEVLIPIAAEFPPGYVEELLRSYTSDYKDQFFNLSEIVFKCKTDPIE